jgi:hypothetical protein
MNRKTLIAGVVFAGLALVTVMVLRSPEKGTRTGENARPVAKLSASDFDTLEVTKGAVTTVLKREGGAYKVEKPMPYAADQDAAKQAFEGLEKLEFDGIISDQKSKHDEYEVGAAGLRVVAKKGDKPLADLRVGKAVNNLTMVRLEGKDEVWQAVGSLKYEFDKDASGWRDKSITTFTEADAERIEVASKSGGKIVLTKPAGKDAGAGASEWTVAESSVKVDPFDKTVAPGIISALYSWKANDFADAAKPADTGLDAPENTVTVGLKGGKKVGVLIGKKKGEEDYYVKTADAPQVFLVKKYNVERINKRPVEFREKTICNLNEAEITEVSVARDKDAYTLVRQAGKKGDEAWKVTKPAGVTLDTTKVNAIVGAFKDWKATSFAEDNAPKATGLVKPTATITARSSAKGAGCVLKVGAELTDKQNSYVEKAGAPDVFTVPKWSLDRVLVKVDDLKKKS